MSRECLQTVEVAYGTALTTAVDISVNSATENINICGTTDRCRLTIAAAIGIACYVATCQDMDISVVSLFLLIEVFRIACLNVRSQFAEREMSCIMQVAVGVISTNLNVQTFLIRICFCISQTLLLKN